MSQELRYHTNPWPTRLGWTAVYVVLAILFLIGLSQTVGQIKTHELPIGGVDLTLPYSKYVAGEPISFTIANHYNSPVYVVNKCPYEPLSVYRKENNKWVRVHDKTTQVCNAEIRQVPVPAQRSLTMSLEQWPHLFDKPGTYRLVFLVEYYNALPYKDIEVVAAPPILPAPVATATSSAASSTSKLNTSGTSSSVSAGIGATTSTGGNATKTFSPAPAPAPAPTPAPTQAPVTNQTWTEHLGLAAGKVTYTTTSYTIKVGDSINFIYDAPRTQEVITNFNATAGPAVSSLTVDSEFTQRTRKFSAAGTYTFKAQDEPSNTGTIVVK